jgi:RNA polymerase sigma-70 factor (sigma-E family)
MRLMRGRQSEFEAFAAAQGAGLVKLAFVVCGDRERAQDAAQEALIRVYQRWSRIDDPLAYARRTAVNATRQDWRRERRTDRTNAAIRELVSRQQFDHPQERLLQRNALMAALDALPHAQRAVIVLRYGLQLSEAETAITLDIPIGTVKSRVTRGLARLREILDAEPFLTPTETAPC